MKIWKVLFPHLFMGFGDDDMSGGGDGLDSGSDGSSDSGSGQDNWFDTLGNEYKENPSITKYKSMDEFAKGYLEAQKFIGKDKIPLPKEDADPSEWDMVYDRLGRPKTPEEYEIPQMDMPEELQFQEENVNAFRQKAHELGMNQKQMQGVMEYFGEMQKQSYQEIQQNSESEYVNGEKALRKEWGTQYNENIALANKALKAITEGEEDFADANKQIGNNPKWIKRLANIGKKLSEDDLGTGNNKNYAMTPEQAQGEIAKLQKQLMSMDAFDPERKAVKQKLDDAYRHAYPEASQATAG